MSPTSGDLPAATTIPAGAPGLTFAPEVDATDIAVHYAIPADYELKLGTHTVTAYAGNTLEDKMEEGVFDNAPELC